MMGLSVRGLTVERDRRTVVEDVSFSAPAGQLTAVLGARGAGKTTLFAAAAGLLPALRGAVLSNDADVTRERSRRRRGVALLAPGTVLGEGARLADAVRAAAGRRTAGQAGALLERAGLSALAERRLRSLSHGEHFAALAAARLLPEGASLLVDEAATGLGEADRGRLLSELRALAKAGRAVVFATRDERFAQEADHLVMLADGQVLQMGTPASCYAEPRSAPAAALIGAANILEGIVRERRPGGFIWTAAGVRFRQTITAEMVPPPLGGQVLFCLRPERAILLGSPDQADNALAGKIATLTSHGPSLVLGVETACGPLRVTIPSWPRPDVPVPGGEVVLGWSAGAATLLGPPG